MDDLVRVWEYSPEGDLRLKHKLAEHSLGVVSVNLTKDAKRKFLLFFSCGTFTFMLDSKFFPNSGLVSSSLDSSIHVWDVETGQKLKTMENGPMECWTVAFSPCGTKIISGSNGGKIHVYSVETGQKEKQLDKSRLDVEVLFIRRSEAHRRRVEREFLPSAPEF